MRLPSSHQELICWLIAERRAVVRQVIAAAPIDGLRRSPMALRWLHSRRHIVLGQLRIRGGLAANWSSNPLKNSPLEFLPLAELISGYVCGGGDDDARSDWGHAAVSLAFGPDFGPCG